MKFKTDLSWDGQEGGQTLFKNGVVYQFDTPIEFGGKAKYPSPEELFVSSVGACLITSFLHFRKKLRLSLNTLKVSVNGKLERVGAEGHRMTGLVAIVTVGICYGETEGKVKKCFDLTAKFCPLTRTLENCVPIDTILNIATPPSA